MSLNQVIFTKREIVFLSLENYRTNKRLSLFSFLFSIKLSHIQHDTKGGLGVMKSK